MFETLHKIFLAIHVPAGTLSLILFWIPVGVKKGSPLHKKVGWYYFMCMWVVLVTAILLSVCNVMLSKYIAAMYLGYLAIITAYPLWYSYEILKQKGEWSELYFSIRKLFTSVLFLTGVGMIALGLLRYGGKGMGTMMIFFGAIALPSGREFFMSKAKAMDAEKRIAMHVKGTIISGIAAYTAFFAFGGSRILVGTLGMHHQWMMVPWILPSVLGVIYMRYMKKKYKAL